MTHSKHTCWFLVCGPLDEAQAERFKRLVLVAGYQWGLCGYDILTDCFDYGVDPEQMTGDWVRFDRDSAGAAPLTFLKDGDRVVTFCVPEHEGHMARLGALMDCCQTHGVPLETVWV